MLPDFRKFGVLLAALLAVGAVQANEKDVWLLVETMPHVLKVMEGDRPKEIFERIALGRNGVGYDKRRGDDKTPLGTYHIGWVNHKSRFGSFFGFNFPNHDNARRAFDGGLIDLSTYHRLLSFRLEEEVPPQDTPLGGQIGIHGIGKGSLRVHQHFDWTHGCIALTNQQLDRLKHWVKKGMLVVIR